MRNPKPAESQNAGYGLESAADEAMSSLADDYMWGFESKDENERRELGLVVAQGCGTDEDIKHFTNHSLLRGVEEWDQMISCATAMKEKATFRDPLAGQDLLTFLSQLVLSHAVTQWSADNEAMLRGQAESEVPPSSLKTKKGIKRKRKGVKDKDSPYWATAESQAQSQTQAQTQAQAQLPPPQPLSVSEKVQQTDGLTRVQKRKMKKILKKQLRNQKPAMSIDSSGAPVLQEASVWYRTGDNAAAPEQIQEHIPMSDGDPSSVDGGVSLKDKHS